MKKLLFLGLILSSISMFVLDAATLIVSNKGSNDILVSIGGDSFRKIKSGSKYTFNSGTDNIYFVEWEDENTNKKFKLTFRDNIGWAILGSTMTILDNGSYTSSHENDGIAKTVSS